MIKINYKINRESLQELDNHYQSRPSIYGVFVVESDIGFSLRDKSMVDDDVFDLFKFNDDLLLWFLNITLMNYELAKYNKCQFVIGYDLDNAPPYSGILFERDDDLLYINNIQYNAENAEYVFKTDMPNDYQIVKKNATINLIEWLNESLKATQLFLNEIRALNPEIEKYHCQKIVAWTKYQRQEVDLYQPKKQ